MSRFRITSPTFIIQNQMNLLLNPLHRLLLLSAVFLASCGTPDAGPDESADQRIPVNIEPVEVVATSIPVPFIGEISPAKSFNVSFRTGGFIESLLADEGDTVRRGQVLATLNRREIDAQVSRAETMLAKGIRDLDRMQRLFADNAVTLEQMQDQQSMVELLRADVEIARFNQEFSVIRAPSDGVVLQKMAEMHEQVAPGNVIFRLGELGVSTAVVQAGISDRDITHLRLGDTAIINVHSSSDLEFTGKITRIPAQADTRSGIYTVEITLDSESESQNSRRWRNGMLVRGQLYPSATMLFALIPVSALVEADGQDIWIYTPTSDRLAADRRRVRPLYITDTIIFVEPAQLEGATTVITRGAAYLRPGTPLQISQEVQP